MALLTALAASLAWLGRQGTRAVAVTIFLGLALPPLAALFKPYLPASIFGLLCLAFLRVEPAALRAQARRPGLAIAATAWTMLVTPALAGSLFVAFGLSARAPDLMPALILQTAGAPLMSATAFAALLGLDAALTLAIMVLALAIVPFTAPVFAQLFLGAALEVSPILLSIRLLAMLAGAAGLAAAIRWLAGRDWIERHHEHVDGLNIVMLFFFAVTLMDGVVAHTITDPLLVLGLVVLSVALSLGTGGLTMLAFLPAGRDRALAIAFAAAQRNMGLMLAAMGGAVPEVAWLYFALAQFPIYLSPQLLKPLARRLAPAGRAAGSLKA